MRETFIWKLFITNHKPYPAACCYCAQKKIWSAWIQLLDSAQNFIYRAAFTRLIYENKDENGDDYGWMSRTQKHSEFNTNI